MSRFTEKFAMAVVTLGVMVGSASALAAQPLKVAGQDVPPWVVHDKGSSALSGIFVDLTDAIAKDAGLQVDYQVVTFADLIPALTSGKIDVIATEMAITPARAQKVDFSIPVYNAPRETVVVLASDPTAYDKLADLKHVPVGVQKGSIQYALLQKTGGFSDLKVYDTVKDVWSAVASGQVKAAVTPGADTIFAAKQGEIPNLRIVSSYQSPSPIPRVGIAVRKGEGELLDKINSSLAKLEADGTVKAIFAKYGVDDWALPK